MKTLLALLLINVLLPLTLLADVRVHVVFLKHPDQQSNQLTEDVFGEVLQGFRALEQQVAPRLRIAKLTIADDPFPEYAVIGRDVNRWYKLEDWANQRQRKYMKGFDAVHFIVSPFKDGAGTYFIGGWARTCSFRTNRAYSISNATAYNIRSLEDRVRHSTAAMSHEIGHVLGAPHISEPLSIMHPTALHFVTNNYPEVFRWLPESAEKIKKCMNGRTRRAHRSKNQK